MPIREYICSKCGMEFESIDLGRAKSSASTAIECPGCGSKKVERTLSSFSSPGGASSSSSPRDTKSSSNRFR